MDKNEEHKPGEKEADSRASRILNIAAYPISAASGYLVWKTHVYQESLSTRERKGDFDDLKAKSQNDYKIINDEIKNNNNLTDSQKREKLYQHRRDYDKARGTRFKEKGFTNILHHYKGIAPHAQDNALISGLTIFGVGLGVMLTVANSKNAFNQLLGKDDKDKGASK